MKCMSCGADIPPQWVTCINENKCPGCGGTIMDLSAKELLDELRTAMSKMPNDPEGLAGWLLSNYTLHKIGSAEPTVFHRKQTVEVESVPVRVKAPSAKVEITGDGVIQTDISVADFFQRAANGKTLDDRKLEAEVIRKEKGGTLSSIAQSIMSDDDVYIEDTPFIPPPQVPQMMPQQPTQYQAQAQAQVQAQSGAFEREAAQAMMAGRDIALPTGNGVAEELASYFQTINNFGFSPVLENERQKRMQASSGICSSDGRVKIQTRRS